MPSGEELKRAKARGEGIRDELLAALRGGPATAADLLPQIKTADASLSEVGFQLGRLAEEGRVVGQQDSLYTLREENRS